MGMSRNIRSVLEGLESKYHEANRIVTGHKKVDAVLTNLKAGEVTILAGAPCGGATEIALKIAYSASLSAKSPSVYVSNCFNGDDLTRRLLGLESGIRKHDIEYGRINEKEWPKLIMAAAKISEVDLHIKYSVDGDFDSICSEVKTVSHESGRVQLVVIDSFKRLLKYKNKKLVDTSIRTVIERIQKMAINAKVPVLLLMNLSVEDQKSLIRSKKISPSSLLAKASMYVEHVLIALNEVYETDDFDINRFNFCIAQRGMKSRIFVSANPAG
jgi:replicative DNA helicase